MCRQGVLISFLHCAFLMPEGPFSLQARLYWPQPEALDPLYVSPSVLKA
jgi:hypothetical protein